MRKIYLDNAASTKVLDEVIETFNEVVSTRYANVSSSHNLSDENYNLYVASRRQCASLLNVNESEVIFTSGASESINLAIKGFATYYQKFGKHIISSTIEHPAVKNALKYLEDYMGFEVTYIKPVNNEITVGMVESAIREDTILVTLIHVQSEIGYIMPVEKIGEMLTNYKCKFHVDVCQSIGKVEFDNTNVDMFSISFHKIHGFKGSGILVCKKGNNLVEQISGGGQQDYRSGTIPLEFIVSGAKALRIAFETREVNYNSVRSLNDYMAEKLALISNVHLNSRSSYSPFIINFSLLDVNMNAVVRNMWNNGIYFTTKTACSSKKQISSTILDFTNDEELASNSIRVSFSKFNTISDVDAFISELISSIELVKGNTCG